MKKEANISISGSDLVKIIKECKKAHAISFRFGEIEILFGLDKVNDVKQLSQAVSRPTKQLSLPLDDEKDLSSEEDIASAVEQELEDMNLHIEDPVEWQKKELAGP